MSARDERPRKGFANRLTVTSQRRRFNLVWRPLRAAYTEMYLYAGLFVTAASPPWAPAARNPIQQGPAEGTFFFRIDSIISRSVGANPQKHLLGEKALKLGHRHFEASLLILATARTEGTPGDIIWGRFGVEDVVCQ